MEESNLLSALIWHKTRRSARRQLFTPTRLCCGARAEGHSPVPGSPSRPVPLRPEVLLKPARAQRGHPEKGVGHQVSAPSREPFRTREERSGASSTTCGAGGWRKAGTERDTGIRDVGSPRPSPGSRASPGWSLQILKSASCRVLPGAPSPASLGGAFASLHFFIKRGICALLENTIQLGSVETFSAPCPPAGVPRAW